MTRSHRLPCRRPSLDTIRELELTCKSGTGSRFTIESGADYGLEGDFLHRIQRV